MEERGLKISRRKTEYLGCNEHQDAEIHLQGETVKRVKTFIYLGSTLAEDGELDAEVTIRVQNGWKNWQRVSGVLCVRRMNVKIKGNVFRTVVRLHIDISAAYDTGWHRGLKLKLNNVIPDKSLVNFIMTMIASRSFIMHVGADKSKQRFLKNGVPQGSVLAPLLLNLYTSDLPKTQSKKYIYAGDIALMISGETFGPIEQSLSENLDNMSRYFNNWRLKLNTGKTVCTSFHLAHRLAKFQLQVTCEGQNIPHEDNPKYLGVGA